MKKILLTSALVLAASVSQAKGVAEYLNGKVAKADVIDGCGLGWQFNDSRTMMGTTTRGTTNMTVPATFGMTSGTLGCEKIQFAKNDEKAATFVTSNFQTLKSELAEGQGEYVTGMVQSLVVQLNKFKRFHLKSKIIIKQLLVQRKMLNNYF